MSDDSNASRESVIAAYCVVSDYITGTAILEAPINVLRSLGYDEALRADSSPGAQPDSAMVVDPSLMTPAHRERLEVLVRALQGRSPETA